MTDRTQHVVYSSESIAFSETQPVIITHQDLFLKIITLDPGEITAEVEYQPNNLTTSTSLTDWIIMHSFFLQLEQQCDIDPQE